MDIWAIRKRIQSENPNLVPLLNRLLSKIRVSECWEWQGAKTDKGYAVIRMGSRNCLAHRVLYELVVGIIPEGLCLDHLCRKRACIRPDHLEPVTHALNILRGEGAPAKHARKTHCLRGHPLSGDNLLPRPKNKGRQCRACTKLRTREASLRFRLKRGQGHGPLIGEQSPNAKLTWDQVKEIRRCRKEENIPIRALARQFGVSQRAVQLILRGRTWKSQ